MRKSALEVINELESRVARLERQANKNRGIEKKVLMRVEEFLIRDGQGSKVAVNGDYESLELEDFKILSNMGVKKDVMRKAFQTDTGFSIGLIRTTYENGVKVSFGLGKGNGTFRNGVQLFIWQ